MLHHNVSMKYNIKKGVVASTYLLTNSLPIRITWLQLKTKEWVNKQFSKHILESKTSDHLINY